MTNEQIIARLMLEIECCFEYMNYDGEEQRAEATDFMDKLVKAGYKKYPDWYRQTEAEKEEIKNLLTLTP